MLSLNTFAYIRKEWIVATVYQYHLKPTNYVEGSGVR